MLVGIVGLPLSGKTTLFHALTRTHAGSGAAPPARREPHRGVVKVADPRLDALAAVFRPKKVTSVAFENVDALSGVPDAGKTALLPSAALGVLRGADALLLVVRAFRDAAVPHPGGDILPARDAETLEQELMLSDLTVIESRLVRLEKELRSTQDPAKTRERAALLACRDAVEANRPLRTLDLDAEQRRLLRGFGFLSEKPALLAVNIGEEDIGSADALSGATGFAGRPKTEVVVVPARLEMELSQLADDEAEAFRRDYGMAEPALDRVVRASFGLLGLVTFFTGGDTELRAWAVPTGTTALEAAGAVHSDFARGFIRAETIQWSDLVRCGSYPRARQGGLVRLEGKSYVVRDGDVLLIRFSP
jgi:GTP-binding protein YchF